MIRSTRHHLKDLNKQKLSNYQLFLFDYNDFCNQVFNNIWDNGYKTLSSDLCEFLSRFFHKLTITNYSRL